ncbi:MAG: 50S ribosomal protein L24e [Hadesarchaea archaeon]|nr:MAG: 50S ribosomal protein L24e [Hadesarchaea archaeon]TDA36383.1 MAG: 50S ribosomal protein L24e [Hadesarchaea archaeon]
MPATFRCSFCGGSVAPGTGTMFVKKDGSILYFCSSKCERNFRLGRRADRTRWTEKYRKEKARGKK